jgi:hypothetical protein
MFSLFLFLIFPNSIFFLPAFCFTFLLFSFLLIMAPPEIQSGLKKPLSILKDVVCSTQYVTHIRTCSL